MSATHPVFEAVDRGEEMIKPTSHPLLRHLHRSNVIRWCVEGKLEALKIGRSYFTTDSLIRKSLLPKAAATPQDIEARNRAALDSISQTAKRRK